MLLSWSEMETNSSPDTVSHGCKLVLRPPLVRPMA